MSLTKNPIHAAIAAGVPADLLLPIAPPTGARGDSIKPESMGKAPARFEGKFWQVLGDWQNGIDRPWLDACAVAGANVGLRLGLPHETLGPILAIDLDFAPGREPLRATAVTAAADSLIDNHLVDAVVRSTVPYRALLLVRLPPGADPGRKVQWKLACPGGSKIELLALGQQVVVGGTHASGNAITWTASGGGPEAAFQPSALPVLPSRLAVLNLVEAILRALRIDHDLGVVSRTITTGRGHTPRMVEDLAPPNVAAVIDLLDRLPNPANTDRATWIAVMLGAKGCIDGLEARGDLTDNGAESIRDAACRWAARWPHAEGLEAELDKWNADWSTRDSPLAGWGSLDRLAADKIPGWRAARAADEFDEISDEPERAHLCSAGDPNWTSMLMRGKDSKDGSLGVIKGNLPNAVRALRHSPDWAGKIAYDCFADRTMLRSAPPWWSEREPFRPCHLKDVDVSRVSEWLVSNDVPVKSDLAREAISIVAADQKFHPVREYLAALKPATRPRIDTWLVDHLGAEDTPFNRAVGRAFLISAVARVMQPGCKVDTVLILEGPQGLRKSTAFEVLAGGWFTDHMPDLANKDAAVQLQGVWIVEFAELTNLSRSDANTAKKWFSTSVDRFRRPYGRIAEDVPRQCVFAGTVNPGGGGYLIDETGNRRYWPVTCGIGFQPHEIIDAERLGEARDELWSDAYAAFLAGDPWWLSADMEIAQVQVVGLRMETDVWEERVTTFLGERTETTTDEILIHALNRPTRDWTKGDSIRVGRIIATTGWRRVQRFRDGRKVWVYVAPADWVTSQADDAGRFDAMSG